MNADPAKLNALDGKLAGRSYTLGTTTVLGRIPGAQVQIPDVKVSREHSKIFRQGDDYFIVDLNSRNGTHVNDAPVTRRLLKHGDELLIGSTHFRFENPPPAVEKPPPAAAPKAELRQKSEPKYREVIDLAAKPKAAPAGAIRADEIVVKDRALQFHKVKSRKRPSLLFDDMGQRSFLFQLLMAVVVIGVCAVFLLVGLKLGGLIGGD